MRARPEVVAVTPVLAVALIGMAARSQAPASSDATRRPVSWLVGRGGPIRFQPGACVAYPPVGRWNGHDGLSRSGTWRYRPGSARDHLGSNGRREERVAHRRSARPRPAPPGGLPRRHVPSARFNRCPTRKGRQARQSPDSARRAPRPRRPQPVRERGAGERAGRDPHGRVRGPLGGGGGDDLLP